MTKSKYPPFLFSTPMVQAIQDGRKTMTRRTIKEDIYFDDFKAFLATNNKRIKPKANIGDIIWVRETFVKGYFDDGSAGYRADWNQTAAEYVKEPKWQPNIFMPKEVARIFLLCTGVRIEELHDITADDAIAEGIEFQYQKSNIFKSYMGYRNYMANQEDDTFWFKDPIESFKSLWESINGSGSWELNPNVFCYSFARVEKPKDFN